MIEIWINCPDRDTARGISDVLIASRLAACTNTFPEIESNYRWKGRIENEPEVPLVAKTRQELFPLVVEEVRRLHPYETPGIIGVPVEFANKDFLAWVYAETERE